MLWGPQESVVPEPRREAWVTFTGDPKGPDTLAKGTCSEAQDGVGVRGVPAWPGHVGGVRPVDYIHWGTNTGSHTLSPALPSAAGR